MSRDMPTVYEIRNYLERMLYSFSGGESWPRYRQLRDISFLVIEPLDYILKLVCGCDRR